MIVGVDLDGVLGNQIEGVLPVATELHGTALKYEDIVHWRLPVGDTDIAKLIVAALADRDYVLSMPVHPGAVEMMRALGEHHRVVVLTARPEAARAATEEWLRQSGLVYDELAIAAEAQKSLHATDVLVDDYVGNLREYLTNTDGLGVLIRQPWNLDRDELTAWRGSRLVEVDDLRDVAQIVGP